MKRISHDALSTTIGAVYLGLMTNLLLAVACAPMLLLMITTDPVRSWPLLAVAVPLCGPAVVAAFAAFADHRAGGVTVVRTFVRAWLRAWRRPVVLGVAATALVVVALVDVKAVSTASFGIVVAPVLLVFVVLAATVALLGFAAFADAPGAPLRRVVKAALYFGVRRWYLTLVSLAVLGTQFAVFTSMPAIGIGLTAAPALYLAWANCRFSLSAVLTHDEVPAVVPGS
ncbi:DUF624 domain-containing protein [Microbacterium protaetiae]|uniref:DUF624 domain-containing protein n=1 Tax=Microbacterium protaetiae TaxID=2509458 RepID=A0A4V0YDC7_9MICO|nr:DUF624 domain-containing protein [Microbacterium protaetiae]QAY60251.1 DUF624 domain-containing protein [Microbacterium protaetiae]